VGHPSIVSGQSQRDQPLICLRRSLLLGVLFSLTVLYFHVGEFPFFDIIKSSSSWLRAIFGVVAIFEAVVTLGL
jgi:hypothetical protein